MENDPRLERKWVFNNTDNISLLVSLMNSSLHFRNQFDNRQVNSIYFDNLSLSSITDNLDGVSNREKIRLRWYGNNTNLINKPILERKIKKNFYGYKKYYPINNFKEKKLNDETLSKLTDEVNNLIKYKDLHPTSITNYKRMYLISSNKLIRATLDYNIQYKKIINYIEDFFINSTDIILEIKYPKNLDLYLRSEISGITRMKKNSKYINSLLNDNFY